jgi:hypothetical protein
MVGLKARCQNYTESLTTATSNDWTAMISAAASGNLTSAAGSTQRGTTFGGGMFEDSNGPITPAGSTSLGLSGDVTNNYFGSVMAAFRP